MHWIDGHLDLAYLALAGCDLRRPLGDRRSGCVSLPALREGRVNLVFATIFTEVNPASDEPWAYAAHDDADGAEAAGLRQLEVYEQLEAEGELSIIRSTGDLDRDGPLPKIALLMEGADPIRSPAHLEKWRDRGVRMIGLTWAAGTRYAGGNVRSAQGPLTPLGRELLAAMEELCLVPDASHLADQALDDLLANSQGPIIATHSNCRALAGDRQRHLRDDHITAIGERGGVIGLNLFSKFIVTEGEARITDAIDHVERIASLMGHRRGVALGSDMDGGFSPAELPESIGPQSLGLLARELASRGWSEEDIGAFAHANWMRFLRSEVLKFES